MKLDWFDDPPKEPGDYWFYGEPYMGEMGGHYTGTVKPCNKLILVEVHRIINGLAAVGNGNFVPLRKWDGKNRGYLGKWANATLPEIPDLNDKEKE